MALLRSWVQTGGHPGNSQKHVWAESVLDSGSVAGLEITLRTEELEVYSASAGSFLYAFLWKRKTWTVMTMQGQRQKQLNRLVRQRVSLVTEEADGRGLLSLSSQWGLTPVLSTQSLRAQSLQLYPTLCDPVGCSPPGFSIHGILQARVLEWVAMTSSRGSS